MSMVLHLFFVVENLLQLTQKNIDIVIRALELLITSTACSALKMGSLSLIAFDSLLFLKKLA